MAYCVYCGSGGVGRFCTSCGKEQPNSVGKPRQRKKIKLTRRGLAITGAILLVLGVAIQQAAVRFVLPYSGPLVVEVTNASASNEAQSLIYQLVVNDSRLTLPGKGNSLTEEFEWVSTEPLEVQLTSKLMRERDLNLNFDPKSIEPFGLDPGKPLKIDVFIAEKTIFAKLQVEDTSFASGWKDLLQDTTSRINFQAEIDKCVTANEGSTETLVAYAETAFDTYLTSLERARLDGERDLYYYEWADRSNLLVSYLQDAIDEAPEFESSFGVSEWSKFVGAFEEAKLAWEYLADVSDRESDAEWDIAWEAIYDAEAKLEQTANAYVRVGSNTYESCLATLYK